MANHAPNYGLQHGRVIHANSLRTGGRRTQYGVFEICRRQGRAQAKSWARGPTWAHARISKGAMSADPDVQFIQTGSAQTISKNREMKGTVWFMSTRTHTTRYLDSTKWPDKRDKLFWETFAKCFKNVHPLYLAMYLPIHHRGGGRRPPSVAPTVVDSMVVDGDINDHKWMKRLSNI